MQRTTNYNMKKPGLDDPIHVGDLNDNFDIIDAKLKEIADSTTSDAVTQAQLQTAINGVNQNVANNYVSNSSLASQLSPINARITGLENKIVGYGLDSFLYKVMNDQEYFKDNVLDADLLSEVQLVDWNNNTISDEIVLTQIEVKSNADYNMTVYDNSPTIKVGMLDANHLLVMFDVSHLGDYDDYKDLFNTKTPSSTSQYIMGPLVRAYTFGSSSRVYSSDGIQKAACLPFKYNFMIDPSQPVIVFSPYSSVWFQVAEAGSSTTASFANGSGITLGMIKNPGIYFEFAPSSTTYKGYDRCNTPLLRATDADSMTIVSPHKMPVELNLVDKYYQYRSSSWKEWRNTFHHDANPYIKNVQSNTYSGWIDAPRTAAAYMKQTTIKRLSAGYIFTLY